VPRNPPLRKYSGGYGQVETTRNWKINRKPQKLFIHVEDTFHYAGFLPDTRVFAGVDEWHNH
jgi:hypothetical protein